MNEKDKNAESSYGREVATNLKSPEQVLGKNEQDRDSAHEIQVRRKFRLQRPALRIGNKPSSRFVAFAMASSCLCETSVRCGAGAGFHFRISATTYRNFLCYEAPSTGAMGLY